MALPPSQKRSGFPPTATNKNQYTNENDSDILFVSQVWDAYFLGNTMPNKTGRMSSPRPTKGLCGSLALLIATSVSAEELSSDIAREVIIVGGYQEAYETAGSAHFLGPEELLKFNYSDIQDIIREVPGVSVQLEDGYGLRPNLSIRGTPTERSSRVTLLEDGVLIAPAPYSAPSAYYFPTAGRMHAFEVLKGPAAITQGPYTIGGALNMISTPIPRDMAGGLLVEGGGYSDRRLHAHAGFTSDTGVGLMFETHDWGSDGFQKIDRDGGDTGLGIQDHTFKIRYATPDSRHQLDFKYQYADQDSDQSYLGLTDADFRKDPYRRYGLSQLDNIKTQHDQHILRYRFKASDSLAISVTAYNNEHERNWFKTEGLDLDGTDNGNSFEKDSWYNVIQTVNKGDGRCLAHTLSGLGLADGSADGADPALTDITVDSTEISFSKGRSTVAGDSQDECDAKLITTDSNADSYADDKAALAERVKAEVSRFVGDSVTETDLNSRVDTLTNNLIGELAGHNASGTGESIDYFSNERLQGILDGTEDTAEGGIQLKSNSREYFSRGVQVRLDWNGELSGAHHDVEVGLRYHEDEEDRIQRIDAYTQKGGKLILHDAGDWGHQSAGNRLQEAEAISVYVHDRIEWGSWVFTPGFRYEDIKQKRTRWEDPEPGNPRANFRSTRKNDTSVFLPGMGVLFNVDDNWSVLAGYHKGFSAPSNSPGVKEEEADNYELGVRYAGTHVRGEVIAFYSDYENLVGECTNSSGGNCEPGDAFNGDAATVEGVEAMFVANVPLDETLNLPLSLSYTYIDGEFDTSFADSLFFGDVEKGDPLPYIPEHQMRVSMGLESTDWSVNLSGKYSDEICVKAACGAFEKTDSSFTVDLSGSYRINKNINLIARVENVTDQEDLVARHPYGARPNKPRTAMLGLRVENFF